MSSFENPFERKKLLAVTVVQRVKATQNSARSAALNMINICCKEGANQ